MIYLSSADMMTRNTEHRVEIAFPVLDPTCRALVHEYMGMQLRDNVKARSLTSDGTWVPVERTGGEKPFNSQEALLERAYRNAEPRPSPSLRQSPPLLLSRSRPHPRFRRSRRPSLSPSLHLHLSPIRRSPSPHPRRAPVAISPLARPRPSSAIAPAACAWAWV